MDDYDDCYDYGVEEEESIQDPAQKKAREELLHYFGNRKESVFFSRQIEIQHEEKYFHWVTNRAIRDLINEKYLLTEARKLKSGGEIKII